MKNQNPDLMMTIHGNQPRGLPNLTSDRRIIFFTNRSQVRGLFRDKSDTKKKEN